MKIEAHSAGWSPQASSAVPNTAPAHETTGGSDIKTQQANPPAARNGGPHHDDVHAAVDKLNAALAAKQVEARYAVDKTTNIVVVKITNATTGDVVRQIPNEQALHLAAAISEMAQHAAAAGEPHLLDEKA